MKLAFVPFLLLGSSITAQQLTLVAPTEITNQRKLLEQAWREWEAADAGLERSLFTAPMERVLSRIEGGRRYAIAYHDRRAAFLESLIRALQRELAQLEKDDRLVAPAVLAPDPRKLDLLLEEQRRLESRARSSGLSLLEKGSLAEQGSLLRQLAENIAAQQALSQAFKDGEEQSRKARHALVESYRALTQFVEQQLRLNEEKRELWLQYYDSLRELVQARRPAGAVPKATKAARERH